MCSADTLPAPLMGQTLQTLAWDQLADTVGRARQEQELVRGLPTGPAMIVICEVTVYKLRTPGCMHNKQLIGRHAKSALPFS